MLVHGPEYGTQEWRESRVGCVTASHFLDVLAGEVGNPAAFGKTAMMYALEILEGSEAGPQDGFTSADMQHGLTYEPFAIEAYSRWSFNKVQPGYFFRKSGTRIGATPDGLVGTKGTLQVKCPKLRNHLATLMEGKMPPSHIPQVQGELWVTGRDWCDFVSYHPDAKPERRLFVQRVVRNDKFIGQVLMPRVIEFCKLVDRMEAKVNSYALRPNT